MYLLFESTFEADWPISHYIGFKIFSKVRLGSAELFGQKRPKGSVSAEPENPGSVAHYCQVVENLYF